MADQSKKSKTQITRRNVIESLKDLGAGSAAQTKDLLKNTSEDFIRELLGLHKINIKRSGELTPGESLQMNDVLSGKEEGIQKEKRQIKFERTLLNEETKTSREKSTELKVELQAIMQEIQKVAVSTGNLAEATKVATISAPAQPGIYHINFFQNILEFLQSFRKKIDLAATWLNSTNRRAEKKNYWVQYHKKGTSFLLNPESYSQRSAG